jgi:hypothetical protein
MEGMRFDLDSLLGAGLCFLPVGLVLAVIYVKRMNHKESRRAPFDELHRRPAGETLRRELENLESKINDATLGLVLLPGLLAFAFFRVHPPQWQVAAVFMTASAGTAWFFGHRLFRLMQLTSTIRQGYEGERYVGEELSRLIGLGFEVYHDVPFEGYNIDHVLVGSRGVFIVETKTFSKPVGEAGKAAYRVQFDGKVLRWQWGEDSRPIEQARRNAKAG